MEYINKRMAEYIFCYIWFHYGKEKIHCQRDIIEALEDEDACADLKDQLWMLFYEQAPTAQVMDRIEEEREKLKQNGMEDDEEETVDESESESESDCDSE